MAGLAGTIHRAPWEQLPRRKLQEDIWELYDARNDFSLNNNLAASNPEKLKELQDLFHEGGEKYRVLPIDDRVLERINGAATAGRPDLMGDRNLAHAFRGHGGHERKRLHQRQEPLALDHGGCGDSQGGANGVIIAQAGRFGGWSLYLKDGSLRIATTSWDCRKPRFQRQQALPAGKATVRMNFDYDGGGVGKGGTASILVNGQSVASGRIERTQGMIFSADETAGVGQDDATPVTTDYKERDNSFTGKILKVTGT